MAAKPKPRTKPPMAPTARDRPAGAEQWGEARRDFLEKHQAWWDRVNRAGPVYALPPPVVESLALRGAAQGVQHHARHAIVGPDDARAERDFTDLCGDRYVGLWNNGSTITFLPLLQPPDVVERWQQISDRYFTVPSGVRPLADRMDAYDHQALGYVGWLTFNADFRAERDRLRLLHAGIQIVRPLCSLSLPYLLRLEYAAPAEETDLPPDTGRFLAELLLFLQKWELAFFETWDLPYPQLPQFGTPVEHILSFVGPQAIVDYVPNYFDLETGDDLRKRVRDRQRGAAQQAGGQDRFPLSNLTARAGSPSQYETMFRMWLIEESVRRRYGTPRGLVERLTEGFEKSLGLARETVRRYRRQYRPHLSELTAVE